MSQATASDFACLIEKFEGVDFHQWKIKMKRLLMDRALWKVVSGDEVLTDNATDEQKKAFKEKDEKALTQLIMCVGNT